MKCSIMALFDDLNYAAEEMCSYTFPFRREMDHGTTSAVSTVLWIECEREGIRKRKKHIFSFKIFCLFHFYTDVSEGHLENASPD
jgi:hypothetical protein